MTVKCGGEWFFVGRRMRFIVGLLISNSQMMKKDVLSCLLWDFHLWGMRTYNLEAKTPWIVSPLYNSSKRQLLVVLKTSLRKRMNREIMNSRLIGLETGEEQLLNKPSLVTCESHQVYSLIEISWWMQQISLVWLHFTILLRSWLLLAGYASYAGVGASSERQFSRVEKEDSSCIVRIPMERREPTHAGYDDGFAGNSWE